MHGPSRSTASARGTAKDQTRHPIMENIVSLIEEVRVPDTESEATSEVTDFEAVASFNWLDEEEPTIAVPGGLGSLRAFVRR